MSEPYQIGVTTRAARDLQRVPDKIATACVEFIFRPLAANPHRVGKALRAELGGSCSARRGDYRIVYAIRDATHLVEVDHIDQRTDVYR